MHEPHRRARLLLLSALLVGIGARPARALDWLQFGYDASKSGNDTADWAPNASSAAGLHRLYVVSLPAIADGAPAFLADVPTAGGVRDLLFLTTKTGTILALDAANGSTVWSHPTSGPNYTTSSPAIDPSRQYVYSYGLDGKVHKYAVGSGNEVTAGWPAVATLKPSVEKGSAALAIATAADGTARLYVANGGYPGDAGDYQGHVTAVDLQTGTETVFNAACSDQAVHFVTGGIPDCAHVQNAVWARAGVVYDARLDRILFATGNGDYDANSGGHDWGDSVLALAADATGAGGGPLDSYTPTNYQNLQNADADLGSTAPALLPAGGGTPHLAVQTGKDSRLRLLDLDDLSGQGGPGHTGGEIQLLSLDQGGGVLTTPAVWRDPSDGSSWVFVANGNGLSAYRLSLAGTPALEWQWTDAAGGTSPIVVNGVLYYLATSGTVRALAPTTDVELWSDPTPTGVHWESPIVVDGRLFVTDDSGHLIAYSVFVFHDDFDAGSFARWSWAAGGG